MPQHAQAVQDPQTEDAMPLDPGVRDVPVSAGRRTQQRRKRLACRRCQARKIKCDGLSPKCTACQRAKTECSDGKTTLQGPMISRVEVLRLQEQNRRLLEVLQQRWPTLDVASMAGGPMQPQEPEQPQMQLDPMSTNTPHLASASQQASPDDRRSNPIPPTPGTTATPRPGESVPSDIAHDLGMIPLSAGVNKYVGPSSGFSMAKLVLARADEAGAHKNHVDQDDEATAEARCRSMFTITPSALPASTEQAVQLSMIYFEQVHPRYPFLHQQTHMCALQNVYHNRPGVTRAMEFQVTMVLAISATILSRRLRIPFSGEGLCAAAMEYSDEIDFQSSLEGVQCLLLISMFTLHSPFLGINPWYLNYQCLAAVLDLGLQQDIPAGQTLDAFEQQMRTRVFWVVFCIDRIIATTLGRPVGLREESCDLRLPHNLEDHQLDELRTRAAPHESDMPAPEIGGPISAAIVHFKLALLNSEIVHILHSVSPNAPQHTFPRVTDVETWQSGLYERLMSISRDFPTFSHENRHCLALCQIRWHEIVMLLFRPTPRIRTPHPDSLTRCYQSAEATILLWKELYNSDRMSYSWTSIHSISLSAIIILYCIWMVRELAVKTEIDGLTQTMTAASNLLSAAGEHWQDARRCRNSLNNLTSATVRWLVTVRSSRPQSRASPAPGQEVSATVGGTDVNPNGIIMAQQQLQMHPDASGLEPQAAMWPSDYPWVDTYINGEDLASLFKAPNLYTANPSLTMEGMFSDYQPLFDFYQGNEFGM